MSDNHEVVLDDLRRIFAANVKASRKALGLSQNAVARAIRMSQATVWAIERGRRDMLLSTMERLADRLRTSVQETFAK